MAWATRNGITAAAAGELMDLLAMPSMPDGPLSGKSEAASQVEIRLEAPALGTTLWRNNVGALLDDRGVPVRYGLANDSKKLNRHIKSSDLIGFHPLKIRQHHVGRTIAVFVGVEVKPGNWEWHGTDREVAQHRFASLICLAGGAAGFARGKQDLRAIIHDLEE